MKKILSLLTIIFFINVNAQNSYFPTKGNWETKSPEFFRYDSKKINKAIDFVIKNQNNGNINKYMNIFASGPRTGTENRKNEPKTGTRTGKMGPGPGLGPGPGPGSGPRPRPVS